jgi:hypothetical protein
VIALSIVFLASELVRQGRGEIAVAAQPWLVAFVFGLLHGLGFAGALSEVGLPPTTFPRRSSLQRRRRGGAARVRRRGRAHYALHARDPNGGGSNVPAYAIGSIATFWLVQRTPASG